MVVKKHSYIVKILICCILCGITLFVSSHRFVNGEVTPKWLGLILMIGITGMAWSMLSRIIILPARPVDTILIVCIALIFIRSWVTSGTLLMYPVGLLLLFFLIQHAVKILPLKYLSGTVAIFALALSLQGVLQYAGELH